MGVWWGCGGDGESKRQGSMDGGEVVLNRALQKKNQTMIQRGCRVTNKPTPHKQQYKATFSLSSPKVPRKKRIRKKTAEGPREVKPKVAVAKPKAKSDVKTKEPCSVPPLGFT